MDEQEKTTEKKVLICCVTYDKHAFVLDRFLRALNNQTHQKFNVLFVDNSETENYAKILQDKGKGLQVKVVRDPPLSKSRIQRIVSGRQKIREEFLKGSWQYLLFVDTDIIIPPDTIERLIAHDKDIVSGVCICVMNIKGKLIIAPALYDFSSTGVARLMRMDEVQGNGLQEIDICGFGCCMIKREVIQKISLRYHEQSQSGEDVAFNVDAHKIGFKTFVDKSVKCRHVTEKGALEVPIRR